MTALRALPPAAPELEMLPPPAQAHGESPFAILQKLHRLMRGRYWMAIPLTLLGAIAGGLSGYFATTPKYESVGAVLVQSMISPKVYQIVENGAMQQFNNYVRRQVNFLEDEDVASMALQSKPWQSVRPGLDADAQYRFEKALSVLWNPSEPEWIRVKFQDKNPEVARTAVEQLLAAYEDKHAKHELIVNPKTIGELTDQIRDREAEIRVAQQSILSLLQANKSTDLELDHKAQLEALSAIDQQIAAYELQVEQTDDTAGHLPGAEQDATTKAGLNEAQISAIGRVDEQMRGYLAQRAALQTHLDELLTKFSPEHPSASRTQKALNAANARVREYAAAWMEQHNNMLPGEGGLAAIPGESRESLMKRVASLKKRRDELQERAQKTNTARLELQGLNDEIKSKQAVLAELNNRKNQLTTEFPTNDGGTTTGRIRIMPPNSTPNRPAVDNRKKLAAVGLVLGGGLPLGCFLLWGLVDRRYRYSDDAGTGKLQPTLLGILPYLPGDMQDPEQAAVAAHCVHQIRTLLQISGAHHDRRVFAITSPTSGDGKTSLSLSLGLSFAASGSETCLVDFDMIGGGLSSSMQAKADAGLMDALDRGDLAGHIRPTAYPRLSIMPVGRDDAQDISRLSPELVQRVIEEAKRRFDVVVVDTGPILGSIEASLVAAVADGVILAIGRGQGRTQADRAMEYLANVGATLIGVVFNRAEPNDFKRAVSSASVRSVPAQNGHARPVGRRALPAMGPMASTVATQMNSSDNGAHDHDQG